MARYDYRCPACELVFEVEHAMDEKPTILCPACNAKAERIFEVSGIRLKGSGFYNTDMRNASTVSKTKTATESAEKASTPDTSASGESSSSSSSD